MRMAVCRRIFVCGSLLRVTRQGFFLTAAHFNIILELAVSLWEGRRFTPQSWAALQTHTELANTAAANPRLPFTKADSNVLQAYLFPEN